MKIKKSVLVVDDDENITQAFQRFFDREKVRMKSATNSKQAKALLSSQIFDLLILNIGLNELAGMELLEFKKKHYPDLPTIIISAYPEIVYKWDLEALGMTCFFAKPFDINKLRQAVDFALNKNPNHPINQN